MANAYVIPPAPSLEDNFDFATQQSYSSQRETKHPSKVYWLDGDGFATNRQDQHCPTQNKNFNLGELNEEGIILSRRASQGIVQRVPETPVVQQLQRRFTSGTIDRQLNFSFDTDHGREQIGLRSVSEIPDKYHSVFKEFSHFNFVQSKVLDDTKTRKAIKTTAIESTEEHLVLYTDNPIVTSAPTGSGKTVIFELAIIRLLMQNTTDSPIGKIIYVAPIKALCSERYDDWKAKFGSLGLHCCELTGDSQLDDYFELQQAQIVMTTPEKWDSMTRKWRDYKSLVQLVKLFLIDEVHQLNDESRGPTMEAIVSRMKTIQASMSWGEGSSKSKLRLIAISATIPNIADVAAWLGTSEEVPALHYSIDESHRPVKLRRVVLGYQDASTPFKFDLALNYRLGGVIQLYSDQKPTLVFCATRKGTQQAAGILIKEARFVMNTTHKYRLQQVANSIHDSKLRDLVLYGVGYHHAGMDISDRKAIETMFTAGDLPVLFATSTLAMGVNLPAHLVVIKSTMHYISGMYQECSESQILQMIGRAGRPQFDSTATAVIMTRSATKVKYDALLSGKQLIESNLHRNLIEHLNAEIVLHTITDVSIALEWLRSTFFYIRVKQNPGHYGMPVKHEEMEEKLQKLCLKNLQMLESCSLVKMDDGFTLQHTDMGRLMARYCVAFDSMKRFLGFKGKESLAELVTQLSLSKEFEDVRLRVNEKKVLNTLNKDKNRPTIRFQLSGKIKSTDMKVICLIQAALGCLPLQDFALNQDTQKIMRAASRLSKCLMEVQLIGDYFQSLLSAVTLHKCIQTRLWENSNLVSKQLDKIGLSLSTTLVNAGLTTFQKLLDTSPRELEFILNRHPPFGNQIRDAVASLPCYKLNFTQVSETNRVRCELEVTIFLLNNAALRENGATWGDTHTCLLLIGDTENKVICKQKISDSQLQNSGKYTRKLVIQRASRGDELKVYYISVDRVGVDILDTFTPKYTTPPKHMQAKPAQSFHETSEASSVSKAPRPIRSTPTPRQEHYKPCNHRCLNKAVCGHDCCKNGIPNKSNLKATKSIEVTSCSVEQWQAPISKPTGVQVRHHVDQLHSRASHLPPTSSLNRIKPALFVNKTSQHGSEKYSFQHRYGHIPKPGLHTEVNPSQDTFFKSSSKLCHTPGQASVRSFSNLTAMEKNDPRVHIQDEKDNSSAMHGSDIDQYLDSLMEMEKETGLYYEDKFLKGEDADNGYDAISPLPAEEYLSPMPTPLTVPSGNYGTIKSNIARSNETMTSQKEKKTKAVNKGFQSKTKQMKLPFAGKKRLIDEVFDTGEITFSGIIPCGVDSCTVPHSRARVIEADIAELDGCSMAAFPSQKHANTISAKPSRMIEKSNASLPNNCLHQNSVFGNLPSMDHERSAGSRQTDNHSLASCRSLDQHLIDRIVPKPGVQGEVERKEKDVALLKTAMESPLPTVTQHFPPGPIPCSFFAVGPGESLDDDSDCDVFGSVFSGIF